ncbi:hypothetical protein JWG44_09990 [Leptospira sp. 201903071]|uniref:hypothetical protein n=1 Tax=Leptospira ainazelensis TaxID=2810034 RepID=UPI001966CA0C|nr:hypothetical protein [Leptospira ainazelensis]MBM9500576.1 hypothetical protein [Leptospira ainazelensis]
MKKNYIVSVVLGCFALIAVNCISFAHYKASYMAEGKDIKGSKILMIVPGFSDHLSEEVYFTPFLENQRKNALTKQKKGGIVEVMVDPRKQFQDGPARRSFKMFLDGALYSSLKNALSTANPSVQFLEEKDEKRLAPELKKTFKNPFVPISTALRDELKKKNIQYVLVPYAYSSPGNEIFSMSVSVQQNNDNNSGGGGTQTQTKSTSTLEGGAIVGIRLQLIEVETGESEKISNIYIPWNNIDATKPKFDEGILILVRGIFPPES